jgi:hypothetical protein
MAFYVLFALLALCSGQTVSPTTSPSPSPTPCSAPPGYFCSGGSALICPIGAYCAGGSALNVSCYPVTACTVAGLSAQPPCYWNVSTLAGSGASGSANGMGTSASFQCVFHSWSLLNGSIAVTDSGGSLRIVSPTGMVSTLVSGLSSPCGVAENSNGTLFIADRGNSRILQRLRSGVTATLFSGLGNAWSVTISRTSSDIFFAENTNGLIKRGTLTGTVTVLAGGTVGFSDGFGAAAMFNGPNGIATDSFDNLYIADYANHRIRMVTPTGLVSTIAGNGLATFADGFGTSARFNFPSGVTLFNDQQLIVADQYNARMRLVNLTNGLVTTIAGSGSVSFANGISLLAAFNQPSSSSFSAEGIMYVPECINRRIRQLTCVPCPASYYCISGVPVLCPAGSCCPLSSIDKLLCPKGSFSKAGAANCTLCPAGTFTSIAGSTSCQQCPGGHYCPTGTSSWARLNCGRGNYCPDGSGAPKPCPYQVPPTGGWGALQVQGPAFLVETAHCLNHCFWNFTSGDGMLSKC